MSSVTQNIRLNNINKLVIIIFFKYFLLFKKCTPVHGNCYTYALDKPKNERYTCQVVKNFINIYFITRGYFKNEKRN